MSNGEPPTVPAPAPPDDPDAWYAPGVRAQYEVHPGVVVTVRERRDEGPRFAYAVREPSLSGGGEQGLDRLRDYFADAPPDRPLTRERVAMNPADIIVDGRVSAWRATIHRS
jgi:hypothetical protein